MKQETNHTPGPWEVTRTHTVDAKGNRKPAGVFITSGGDDIAYAPTGENRDANARLIAAAPNLLNMLADGAEMLGKLTGDNLVTFSRTFAALANVAIAKATGKGEA